MQYLELLIVCVAVILAGIALGNAAVYLFNRMPTQWFCDYDQNKVAEIPDFPYTQRIKSYPWKFIFSMFFISMGIYLAVRDPWFAAAALLLMWLMVELSIGDVLYKIIPDQLLILISVTALGFLKYNQGWQDMAAGAAIGFGITGLTALMGKLAYGRETLGGGDIKLFTALGLVLGMGGILAVFLLSTLFSAGHFVILLAEKKIKMHDSRPMAPYIAAAVFVYVTFLWHIWLRV